MNSYKELFFWHLWGTAILQHDVDLGVAEPIKQHPYRELFSEISGRTEILQHDVDVGDAEPIKQHTHIGLIQKSPK